MDERNSILAVRKEQRQSIDEFFRDETANKEEAWGVYGKDFGQYSETFGLSQKILPDFIESVRRRHTPFGLDLLSGTEMLESLKIGGIAVGLTDARSEEQKGKDKNVRWQLTYDLLDERKLAWRAVRRTMLFHHIPAFDLITQRGILGFELISPDPTLHFYHLQQMWSVLAEGGMILTEIGTFDSGVLENNKTYDYWSNIKGIKAVATPWKGLQLFKLPGHPEKLPLNFKPTKKELRKWKLSVH